MEKFIDIISTVLEVTKQNFVCYKGDTLVFNLAFKQEDGTAEDITDWEVYFSMKKTRDLDDDDEGVISVDGVLSADPTTGLATVTLTELLLSDCLGSYFYGIKYKDAEIEPNVKTVMEGKIIFLKNTVSRTAPLST